MNTFRTDDRREWRAWLAANHDTAEDIWLIMPDKASGETGLLYNDAVEEALCFGWIDSTIKRIDETHRAQHYTPRRRGSPYSRPNIERLIWLDRQGLLHPTVKTEVQTLIDTPYTFPKDILAAINSDETVRKHYEAFSEPYKRIRVAYIDAARQRPEEFQKRLQNFLNKTRQGKRIIGYGGIEKYYK